MGHELAVGQVLVSGAPERHSRIYVCTLRGQRGIRRREEGQAWLGICVRVYTCAVMCCIH
jgi:hypothetical protein